MYIHMYARIYLMKFSVKFSVFAFNEISRAAKVPKSFASAAVAAAVAIFVRAHFLLASCELLLIILKTHTHINLKALHFFQIVVFVFQLLFCLSYLLRFLLVAAFALLRVACS